MRDLTPHGQWNRRRFLTSGGLAGVGLLGATDAAAAAPPFGGNVFTLGIASGDPTPQSVVLWTRLAPDPLNGGGMPPFPVLVRWRVAHDAQMQRIVQSGVAVAWPWLAHSVHVEVKGLAADRWYFYQFSVGSEESVVGRTRTLPRTNQRPTLLKFAWVSCQDWQSGFYTAYRNLAREDLDFVVHLGDYIYEYGPLPIGPRQHPTGETRSLESYRNRYALYKSDPHLQNAHAAFPFIVVPDDHEVDNDYAGALSEDNENVLTFLERRANAYRAYYEHMPLRGASFPIGPSMWLYRGWSWGTLAQFSALDTRQYRSDQPCGGFFAPRCPGAVAPSQTMTGAEQEEWLLGRLGTSPARWNVIAQQTMLAQFDYHGGPGPEAQIFFMDQWDGYVAARTRITDFLFQRSPSNPVVITGDVHASWVSNIKTDFDDPSSATVAAEYVGPSISTIFPWPLLLFIHAALPDNPHSLFFEGLLHGYVRCHVTPELWRADYRVVPTTLVEEVDAVTMASFVTIDGVPGAVPG